MSSERTQPPSIAPKKTPASRPAGTPADDQPGVRPVTGPVSGGTAPSMGDRIRRSADSLRGGRSESETSTTAVDTSATAAAAGATPRGTATAGGARTESVRAESARTEPARPASSSGGARKVRLAVARIDPWSVMKLSFLLSVAIGIMIVVAAAVVWQTLDSMAVFTSVNETIATIADDPEFFNLLEYAAFPRVLSLATMIAVVDVVLLTALSTIGAFLYNIVAALVGGITVTLTDD